MKLRFEIPDIGLIIEIDGGSTKFFDMLDLMEKLLHYLRTRELPE